MFYDRIVELCIGKGISATKLAEELGLSTSVITGWKHGSVPRHSTLNKIAEYFGVDASSLYNASAPINAEKKPTIIFDDELAEKVMLFNALSPEMQDQVLDYMRFLVSKQESNR